MQEVDDEEGDSGSVIGDFDPNTMQEIPENEGAGVQADEGEGEVEEYDENVHGALLEEEDGEDGEEEEIADYDPAVDGEILEEESEAEEGEEHEGSVYDEVDVSELDAGAPYVGEDSDDDDDDDDDDDERDDR